MLFVKLSELKQITDYLTWSDDIRYELIDGIPYMMSVPAWQHQAIAGEIYLQLGNFLKGKQCRVFTAPFDVRLNADKNDDTVVQPDITIICERSKITGTGCKGVPDMIIEIVSPSTTGYDKVLKFNKYLNCGVREYWIVEPDSKIVSVHILSNGKYTVQTYDNTSIVHVNILEGAEINLTDVFLTIAE